MRFHAAMALDRVLTMLPRHEHREALIVGLLDDAGEDGMYPVYRSLRNVGDIERLGPDGILALPTIHSSAAVEWLFKELAGEIAEPAPVKQAQESEAPAGPIDYLDIFDRAAGEPGTCVGDRINRLENIQYRDMAAFIAVLAAAVFPGKPEADANTALMRSPDFQGMRALLAAHIAEPTKPEPKSEIVSNEQPRRKRGRPPKQRPELKPASKSVLETVLTGGVR